MAGASLERRSLVIDGESLGHALKEARPLLAEVSALCDTVVCCRMSPIQKAEVRTVLFSFFIENLLRPSFLST